MSYWKYYTYLIILEENIKVFLLRILQLLMENIIKIIFYNLQTNNHDFIALELKNSESLLILRSPLKRDSC